MELSLAALHLILEVAPPMQSKYWIPNYDILISTIVDSSIPDIIDGQKQRPLKEI
jgi:hypothetical protein